MSKAFKPAKKGMTFAEYFKENKLLFGYTSPMDLEKENNLMYYSNRITNVQMRCRNCRFTYELKTAATVFIEKCKNSKVKCGAVWNPVTKKATVRGVDITNKMRKESVDDKRIRERPIGEKVSLHEVLEDQQHIPNKILDKTEDPAMAVFSNMLKEAEKSGKVKISNRKTEKRIAADDGDITLDSDDELETRAPYKAEGKGGYRYYQLYSDKPSGIDSLDGTVYNTPNEYGEYLSTNFIKIYDEDLLVSKSLNDQEFFDKYFKNPALIDEVDYFKNYNKSGALRGVKSKVNQVNKRLKDFDMEVTQYLGKNFFQGDGYHFNMVKKFRPMGFEETHPGKQNVIDYLAFVEDTNADIIEQEDISEDDEEEDISEDDEQEDDEQEDISEESSEEIPESEEESSEEKPKKSTNKRLNYKENIQEYIDICPEPEETPVIHIKLKKGQFYTKIPGYVFEGI